METLKSYLKDAAKHSILTAMGVMFCIISVAGPILGDAICELPGQSKHEELLEAAGPAAMFILIALGVGCLVYSGVIMGQWDKLKAEPYGIDLSTTEYIKKEQNRYKNPHAMFLTMGIILCILSVLPSILFDEIDIYSDFFEELSGMMLFLFVSVGVFFIVSCSMKMSSYKYLLQLNDTTAKGGNSMSAKPEDVKYINKTATAIMSVYWSTVTCIYLIWSFITFDWDVSWIIWPVAAVIYKLLQILLKEDEE